MGVYSSSLEHGLKSIFFILRSNSYFSVVLRDKLVFILVNKFIKSIKIR